MQAGFSRLYQFRRLCFRHPVAKTPFGKDAGGVPRVLVQLRLSLLKSVWSVRGPPDFSGLQTRSSSLLWVTMCPGRPKARKQVIRSGHHLHGLAAYRQVVQRLPESGTRVYNADKE